jgi:hypothetical protein
LLTGCIGGGLNRTFDDDTREIRLQGQNRYDADDLVDGSKLEGQRKHETGIGERSTDFDVSRLYRVFFGPEGKFMLSVIVLHYINSFKKVVFCEFN